MGRGAWQFRTTTGLVTVEADAVTTRSTPSAFVAGQLARWRHGDRRERAKVALATGWVLLSVALLTSNLYLLADARLDVASALFLGSLGVLAYSLWNEHGRRTTIPRSAISRVTLDADARELTITHEAGDGPLSAFRDDVDETTATLPSADDLREAREVLRLRGVDVESPPAGSAGSEKTYRVVTRDGVCFCERCRSQVSPSDPVCPSCDYALWVAAEAAE